MYCEYDHQSIEWMGLDHSDQTTLPTLFILTIYTPFFSQSINIWYTGCVQFNTS